MSVSPIDQFKVRSLGNNILIGDWNLSFSNSAMAMFATLCLIMVFFYVGIKKASIIPNKKQMLNEVLYDFVYSILKDNVHSDKLHKILPFILSLFMFLFVGNIVGLMPGSFAFTSQLVITMGLSVLILILATTIGIYSHGIKFLKILLPSGLPIFLAPIMIILEFISYFTKALSMGVRIFANIMAGHIILEIIAGFIITLGFLGFIPLSFSVLLYTFEFGIAFIQAYIFTILTCLFLDQVINLH